MQRLRSSSLVAAFALGAGLGLGPLSAIGAFAALSPLSAGAQGVTRSADDDVDLLSKAGEARTFGTDSARVELIIFFDFSCPTCQQFHIQRGDSLRRALPADVRVVYVNYLIPNFLRSYHAAEAAACAAGLGGKTAYHGMSDLLFGRVGEWNDAFDPGPIFARYAKDIGADSAAFADCTRRDVPAPLIAIDLATANRFEVTGTPTMS